MVKLIPLSIVIATIVVPMLFSNRNPAKRALRNLRFTMAALILFWAMLCVYVYPQYVFPE